MCRDVRNAKAMEGLLRKAEDGASLRERPCGPHMVILGMGGAAEPWFQMLDIELWMYHLVS